MSGAYLEVVAEETETGAMAMSANGESLAKGSGCLAALYMETSTYPYISDYFRFLENQGWQMVSSNTTHFNRVLYIFRGGYGYKVRWEGDRWVGEENHPSDDDGPDIESW